MRFMSDTHLAINILGEEKVCCLRSLFDVLEGLPPQVVRLRYRADNKSTLDILDNLESSVQLIKRDEKSEHYRLSPYALPLIKSEKSKGLIALMEDIYAVLKEIYMERLAEPVTFKEISDRLEASPSELREAFYYMCEAHDVWCGKDCKFPFVDDSHINISESVIKKEKFIDVLEDYYRWNVISNKKIKPNDLSPKNHTMTTMRFPVNLTKRRSQHEEETIYRRTDYWCAEGTRSWREGR